MKILTKIKNAAAALWRAFSPDRIQCVVCGRDLNENNKAGICEKCLPELHFTGHHICEKCGVKIGGESDYCERCGGNEHSFDACRSVCEFDGLARTLVHRLKFGGQKYLAKYMAYFMSEVFKNLDWQIDVVAFVPVTEKASKKRGYNQAYLLAREFCDIIPLALENNVKKIKETSTQATLNFKQRMANVKNAYEIIDKNIFKGKNVLIIDDVKTTGATVDEISRLLKRSGAAKVYGLTFASRTQKADLI